jgi:hypothetical protein
VNIANAQMPISTKRFELREEVKANARPATHQEPGWVLEVEKAWELLFTKADTGLGFYSWWNF